MNGHVDEFGRALVAMNIRADDHRPWTAIEAWVDTAFNGELVLPRHVIDDAKLKKTAGIEATLADGKATILETFDCELEWFGTTRIVEVIANEGAFPLVGVGLMIGRRLVVDDLELTVSIE